jgi:hypothetical protein
MADYLWLLVPVPMLLLVVFREWLRRVERQIDAANRDHLAALERYSAELAYDEERSAQLRSRLTQVANQYEVEA